MAVEQILGNVAVVTGDLIGSRRYSREQRQQLDQVLKQAANTAGEILPEAVYAPLSFSVVEGDEFQFVLQRPDDAYDFVVLMRTVLRTSGLSPEPSFRCAIGIGELVVNEGDSSYAMDGSAFHFAREGLNTLEKRSTGRERTTKLLTGEPKSDRWFDVLLMYQDLLESRWTALQCEAIRYRLQDQTYETIGKKLGITKQSVDKRLSAAYWDEFSCGMNFITKSLSASLG